MIIFLLFLAASIGKIYGIIGGDPAFSTYQFPYAAAVNIQTSTSKFFCGGTLYGNQWLITAAQCVNGATLFTIKLGSMYLGNEEETQITLATSEFLIHPEFNPLTLDHDIALIRFREPVELSDYVESIASLPSSDLVDGVYTRAFGWGQTTDGSSQLSDILNYIFVTTLSNPACQMYYGSQLSDHMVCVIGSFNEGICHGDTGGALQDFNSHAKSMHVGVASFISGNGCETTEPSGFTRTFPYVDWIRNTTDLDI